MYTTEIDARGQDCPKPVIMTKQALEKIEVGIVKTLVDNEIAKNNVVKMAENLAFPVSVTEEGGQYQISINKMRPIDTYTGFNPSLSQVGSWHLIVTGNTLGRGEEELGQLLIKSFFYALANSDNPPQKIAFLNSGIFLVTKGSPVLESLVSLQEKQVSILACGTCLDYYQQKNALVVGAVSNMYDILEVMALCPNTVVI